MAILDFPTSPTLNQTYTANGKTWTWNGVSWIANIGLGYAGSVGSLGYTGSVGAGYTGSKGVDGYAGSKGVDGYAGSAGINGYTGSTGFTGSASTVAGYTGSTGNAGYTGSTGAGSSVTVNSTAPVSPTNGDMWWNSEEGQLKVYYSDGTSAQWVDAASGRQGISGYTGSTGFTGSASTVQGYTGSAVTGFTGSIGFSGSRGFTGSASTTQGYTGSGGGYTGSIGYFGSRGFTGSIGFTGSASTTQGFTGSAGPAGGYTGSQGNLGYTGSSNGTGYTGSASTIPGYTGSGYFETTVVVPTSSNFTLQNANSSTLTDSTYGLIYDSAGVTTAGIRFAKWTGVIPATPYSIITKSKSIICTDTGSYSTGIVLRNSSTGRIVIAGNYNVSQELVQNWTAYATFSSNIFLKSVFDKFVWRKVTNDGTNLDFYCSADSFYWYKYATTTLASFISSVDEIGFGYHVVNSAGSVVVGQVYSWQVV